MARHDFFSNIGKSIGMSVSDAFENLMPNTKNLASSASSKVKNQVYEPIKNKLTTRYQVERNDNIIFKSTKSMLKNAISDLKSGNIYNKDRLKSAGGDFFSDLDDGNDDFDSFFNDESMDDDDSSYEEETKSSSKKSGNKTLNNVKKYKKNILVKSKKAIIADNRGLEKPIGVITNVAHSILKTNAFSFATINKQLQTISDFQNQNTTNFYNEISEKLSTITENTNKMGNYYDGIAESRNKKSSSPTNLMSKFIGGGLDFGNMYDVFREKLGFGPRKEGGSGGGKELYDMFLKPYVDKVVNNPLGTALTFGLQSMLPKKLKNTMTTLDSIPEMIPALIQSKLRNFKDSNSIFKSLLGSFFSLDDESNPFYSLGSSSRDVATFDERVRTSIVNVMPSLLSKILSAVSNNPYYQSELIFDYDRNKFTNRKAIVNELGNNIKNNSLSGDVSDFKNEIIGQYSGQFQTDEEKEKYANDVNSALIKMIRKGYNLSNGFNYKNILDSKGFKQEVKNLNLPISDEVLDSIGYLFSDEDVKTNEDFTTKLKELLTEKNVNLNNDNINAITNSFAYRNNIGRNIMDSYNSKSDFEKMELFKAIADSSADYRDFFNRYIDNESLRNAFDVDHSFNRMEKTSAKDITESGKSALEWLRSRRQEQADEENSGSQFLRGFADKVTEKANNIINKILGTDSNTNGIFNQIERNVENQINNNEEIRSILNPVMNNASNSSSNNTTTNNNTSRGIANRNNINNTNNSSFQGRDLLLKILNKVSSIDNKIENNPNSNNTEETNNGEFRNTLLNILNSIKSSLDKISNANRSSVNSQDGAVLPVLNIINTKLDYLENLKNLGTILNNLNANVERIAILKGADLTSSAASTGEMQVPFFKSLWYKISGGQFREAGNLVRSKLSTLKSKINLPKINIPELSFLRNFKGFDTLKDFFEKAKDWAKDKDLKGMFNKAKDWMKPFLDNFPNYVTSFKNMVTSFGSSVKGKISNINFNGLGSKFSNGLDWLKNKGTNIKDRISNIKLPSGISLSNYFKQFKIPNINLDGLKGFGKGKIEVAKGAIGKVGSAFSKFQEEKLKKRAQPVYVVGGHLNSIKEPIQTKEVISEMNTAAEQRSLLTQSKGKVINLKKEQIKEKAGTSSTSSEEESQSSSFDLGSMKDMADTAKNLFGKFKGTKIGGKMMSKLSGVSKVFKGGKLASLGSKLAGIKGLSSLGSLGTAASGALGSLGSAASGALGGLGTAASGALGSLGSAASGALGGLGTAASGATGALGSLGSAAAGATGIASKAGGLLGAAGGVLGKLALPLAAAKGVYDGFKGWKNASNDFGTEDPSLGQKASSAAGGILNGLTFGIPDKIFGQGATSRFINKTGKNLMKYSPVGLAVGGAKKFLGFGKSLLGLGGGDATAENNGRIQKTDAKGEKSDNPLERISSVTSKMGKFFLKGPFALLFGGSTPGIVTVFKKVVTSVKSFFKNIFKSIFGTDDENDKADKEEDLLDTSKADDGNGSTAEKSDNVVSNMTNSSKTTSGSDKTTTSSSNGSTATKNNTNDLGSMNLMRQLKADLETISTNTEKGNELLTQISDTLKEIKENTNNMQQQGTTENKEDKQEAINKVKSTVSQTMLSILKGH